VLSRGPYYYDDECELLRSRGIEALVTKNSGGDLTKAKLEAARSLGVDVVMMERPMLPCGVTVVSSVQEAVAWVLSRDNAAE